ncbi:MAG: AMIN domain-containing protein [Synechococcales cyanobacterium RU_4_20]|nr:AMIN domain-containing protein [Synechococcales cyanobacterium RU_4_20]NJR71476.1 AMIN domain-containing protein [Synechococcales cyanobacterium CRU_2_2]
MQRYQSWPGVVGAGLVAMAATVSPLPAQANAVDAYKFDAAKGTFEFRTDTDVIPKAMLLQNPTRVVLDLPGIQVKNPRKEQNSSGPLKEIRLGQFEPGTARIVLEFKPDYQPTAGQMNVRGISYRNWVLEMPRN